MNTVLDADPPQLVVLNGDLITGENTFLENSTVYVDEIVQPLLRRNLPWASTYGNHDSDFNLSSLAMFQRERQWPNARTQRMVFDDQAGVTNYYLPVYASDCAAWWCTPEVILYFFDSRGGFEYQKKNADGSKVGRGNWVHQSVVDWFKSISSSLARTYRKEVPSLAFVHIPTYASMQFQVAVGVDPQREPGINDDYVLAPQAQGWCANGTNGADCTYGGQDVPFMQALSDTPGLLAVFSGHDHGDTWCFKWNTTLPGMSIKGSGMNLCFGQHSGHGGYGTWTRGARQVLLNKDALKRSELETWIRLETAEVVGRVTLNSTYGVDVYPVTNDTYS